MKLLRNNKNLIISIGLLILFLTLFLMLKLKPNNGYEFNSYNIICSSLQWICLFLFLTSLYLLFKNSFNKVLSIIFLIICLFFVPTLNSNSQIECDNDNGNSIIGEDYYESDKKYMSVTPFVHSFINLFNEPQCSKVMGNFESKNHYSLMAPKRKMGISNMYFIHMLSVFLNSFLIFFTICFFNKSNKI